MIETKLILVLLGFARLFCHTHGLQCYNVTDWSVAVPQITGVDTCDTGVTTCVRPRFQDGAYIQADSRDLAAVIWGCGECGTAASCVTPTDQDFSNVPAIYECYNREVITDENNVKCDDVEITDTVTSTVTVRAETSCKRPKIDLDGHFMTGGDAEWGCGKCPDGSGSCVSCDGTRCNGEDFEGYNCLKYKKSSDGAWNKDDVTTKVTCKSEKFEQYCKMPTPDNKAEEWNSCGQNCDDEQCKSCYGDTCNDRDSSKYKWCKVGPADTIQAEVANLPLNFCNDTLGCQRPHIEYGKVVENAADYKCSNEADCIPGSGKCEFCHQGNACNGYPVNNHQCYNWAWNTNQYVAGDLQDCNRGDASVARCNMPKDLQNQVAYTPETNKNGCGKCSTEQADNCITTYAGDNRTPTRNQCYTWTWNSNKYEMGGPVDCNALDQIGDNKDPIICNMPRDLAIKNSYSASENDKGCGSCVNGENDTGCMGSVGARQNKPSDKQCYAWSWDSDMNTYVPGVLRHCVRKYEFRCNKPRDVTKQNAYDPATNENGCGECSTSQAIGCITTPDSRNNGSTKMEHQCFSWSWVDNKYEPGTLIECNQDRVWEQDRDYRSYQCNMPIKPEDKNSYEPEANVNGCGACVKSDCITTFSGENEPTHKCYQWTVEDEGWVSTGTLINCYQADTAENKLKCSLPRNRSNKEGFISNGCGPCPEEEANIADESVEYNCITTGPEKNHGIQVLISFLALVLVFVNVLL